MVHSRLAEVRPVRNPVVVGVTGTSAGLAAVRLAAREAVSRGCQLRVVHAFTWPSHGPPGAGLDYDGARRAASEVVDEAVATAQRSTPGVRVTGQLVDGLPDRVLLRLSRTSDLLVLGDDDLATTPWLPPSSVATLLEKKCLNSSFGAARNQRSTIREGYATLFMAGKVFSHTPNRCGLSRR